MATNSKWLPAPVALFTQEKRAVRTMPWWSAPPFSARPPILPYPLTHPYPLTTHLPTHTH